MTLRLILSRTRLPSCLHVSRYACGVDRDETWHGTSSCTVDLTEDPSDTPARRRLSETLANV